MSMCRQSSLSEMGDLPTSLKAWEKELLIYKFHIWRLKYLLEFLCSHLTSNEPELRQSCSLVLSRLCYRVPNLVQSCLCPKTCRWNDWYVQSRIFLLIIHPEVKDFCFSLMLLCLLSPSKSLYLIILLPANFKMAPFTNLSIFVFDLHYSSIVAFLVVVPWPTRYF